jgi:hypothetical protein
MFLPLYSTFENLGLIAGAVAVLAGQLDVGQELHFDGDGAVAFAGVAAAAGHVEGKMPRRERKALGLGLRGKELADQVEALDVGDGIGARGAADGRLIHQHHVVDALDAGQGFVDAGGVRAVALAQRPRHRAIEHLMHQRGLARAGDAGDGHQHSQRNFHIEAVEVVGRGAAQDQAFPARRTAARGHGDGELAGEIAAGEGVGIGLDLGQYALGQQLAALFARAGAKVEQVVGGAENVGVVLDDDDGVAQVAQLFQNANQAHGVAGVQADGRLVEDVERAHQLRTKRGGQLNALRLAAGERGGKAVESEVFQADRVEKVEPLANLMSGWSRRSPRASARGAAR